MSDTAHVLAVIPIAWALGEDLRPDGVGARVGAAGARNRPGKQHEADGKGKSKGFRCHGDSPPLWWAGYEGGRGESAAAPARRR